MIKPTIVNLNGTAPSALAAGARECGLALREALDKLYAMIPHGRDYQHDVTGREYSAARREHEARIASVRKVLGEVTELFEHAQETENERAARREQRS